MLAEERGVEPLRSGNATLAWVRTKYRLQSVCPSFVLLLYITEIQFNVKEMITGQNLVKLSTELSEDPLSRYNGLSSLEKADTFPVKDRPGPVPAKDVKRYLLLVGKWVGIKISTEPAAIAMVEALDGTFDDFDLSDGNVLTVVTSTFLYYSTIDN